MRPRPTSRQRVFCAGSWRWRSPRRDEDHTRTNVLLQRERLAWAPGGALRPQHAPPQPTLVPLGTESSSAETQPQPHTAHTQSDTQEGVSGQAPRETSCARSSAPPTPCPTRTAHQLAPRAIWPTAHTHLSQLTCTTVLLRHKPPGSERGKRRLTARLQGGPPGLGDEEARTHRA